MTHALFTLLFYRKSSLLKEHNVISVREFRIIGNMGNKNEKEIRISFFREEKYRKLMKSDFTETDIAKSLGFFLQPLEIQLDFPALWEGRQRKDSSLVN